MKAFIICGYGIPADGQETENYRTYLNVAFNQMYELAQFEPALVIPSGGPTNCTPPFEGTEAEHVGRWIGERFKRAEEATKEWEIVLEDQALSSPENLLYAKDLLDARGFEGEIVVFCEFVRRNRMQLYANEVFGEAEVIAIDFDSSSNRYQPKEKVELLLEKQIEADLPIIKNPDLRAEHHAFYEKKLEMLRKWQQEGMTHEAAVKRWWDEYIARRN